MIFHNHKAIFLHIGKTAGSSIEGWLSNDAEMDHQIADYDSLFGFDAEHHMYLQHADAQFTKHLVGDAIFKSYYKFCVVRNPFERLVSVYHYSYEQHEKNYGSFEGYILKLPETLEKARNRYGSHHASQISYTHIDGIQICDHIVHFENLPDSLSPVAKQLGITTQLQKSNTYRYFPWGEIPLEEHYTKQMLDIVISNLRDEFLSYGYSTNIEERTKISKSSIES